MDRIEKSLNDETRILYKKLKNNFTPLIFKDLIAFFNKVFEKDCTAYVFMSRKCYTLYRVFAPFCKVDQAKNNRVITDKAILKLRDNEHETGASITIVDDIFIHGRTLLNIKNDAKSMGISDIHTIVFAQKILDKESVENFGSDKNDLLDLYKETEAIYPLEDDERRRLSSKIVESFKIALIPYLSFLPIFDFKMSIDTFVQKLESNNKFSYVIKENSVVNEQDQINSVQYYIYFEDHNDAIFRIYSNDFIEGFKAVPFVFDYKLDQKIELTEKHPIEAFFYNSKADIKKQEYDKRLYTYIASLLYGKTVLAVFDFKDYTIENEALLHNFGLSEKEAERINQLEVLPIKKVDSLRKLCENGIEIELKNFLIDCFVQSKRALIVNKENDQMQFDVLNTILACFFKKNGNLDEKHFSNRNDQGWLNRLVGLPVAFYMSLFDSFPEDYELECILRKYSKLSSLAALTYQMDEGVATYYFHKNKEESKTTAYVYAGEQSYQCRNTYIWSMLYIAHKIRQKLKIEVDNERELREQLNTNLKSYIECCLNYLLTQEFVDENDRGLMTLELETFLDKASPNFDEITDYFVFNRYLKNVLTKEEENCNQLITFGLKYL